MCCKADQENDDEQDYIGFKEYWRLYWVYVTLEAYG